MSAQKYRQMFRSGLIQVQINLGSVCLRKRFCPHVCDHTDNGNPRRASSGCLEAHAQGILVWPIGPRERLTDHRDLRSFVVGKRLLYASCFDAAKRCRESSAGLRGVQPVRVRGRSFHVIHLPSREVWPAHVPALALAVRSQHKRALARAHQDSHTAHFCLRCESCRPIFP